MWRNYWTIHITGTYWSTEIDVLDARIWRIWDDLSDVLDVFRKATCHNLTPFMLVLSQSGNRRPSRSPANHTIERPNDRQINTPFDWPTDQPNNRTIDRPTARSSEQPTDRRTDRPNDRPTNQPTNWLIDLYRPNVLSTECRSTYTAGVKDKKKMDKKWNWQTFWLTLVTLECCWYLGFSLV